jgi:uncharacterized protein YndB with AHSA1/START domain
MSDTAITVSLAVRAPAEDVWRALTDGAVSPAYYYGFALETGLAAGRPYRYTAGGAPMITGEVLDLVPGERVTMTFNGAWTPEVAALPESRVAYRLDPPAMPAPDVTVLTMTHTGLPAAPVTEVLRAGWVMILSGLKTVVETGGPLVPAPH